MDLLNELISNMTNKTAPSQTEILAKSYDILCEIVMIIREDSLDDIECFDRIEKIVCLLEKNGIDCGGRHDFG